MYAVEVHRNVLKDLGSPKNYTAKVFRQIAIKMLSLSIDPRPADCKPIVGGCRVDSGEYRIYYEIEDKERRVKVWLVGKRNDDEVYKRLRHTGR